MTIRRDTLTIFFLPTFSSSELLFDYVIFNTIILLVSSLNACYVLMILIKKMQQFSYVII